MKKSQIKLIIIDFYGVMTKGSYKETCQWIQQKYKRYRNSYDYLYEIVYHKYFAQAAVGKISERASFELAIKELGLNEDYQQFRKKHLSFQRLNKSVFDYCLDLQKKGYKILLLSRNTSHQFKDVLRKFKIRDYFKNVMNTFDFKLPKSSPKVMKYILKRFKVKPNEVLMVDDQKFNLTTAKQMGIKIVLYKNNNQMKKEFNKYL